MKTKLALFILAALLAAGCSKEKPAPAEKSAAVSAATIKAEEAEISVPYEAEGVVESKNTATMAAKISGEISRMYAAVGKKVSKGEILATIRADEISARLAAAEAELAKVERDLRRETELLSKGASTATAVKDLRDALAAAKARREEAAAYASYADIAAPANAVVTAKFADAGDLAMPGTPICEITDPANLRVRAEIPESLSAKISDGIPLKFSAGGKTFAIKLAEASPKIDPTTRTRTFKFDIENPDVLHIGELGKIALPTKSFKAVAIPEACVSSIGQIDRVFAVENGTARMRIVKLGARIDGGKIAVNSGISAGDVLVLSPSAEVKEGVEIK